MARSGNTNAGSWSSDLTTFTFFTTTLTKGTEYNTNKGTQAWGAVPTCPNYPNTVKGVWNFKVTVTSQSTTDNTSTLNISVSHYMASNGYYWASGYADVYLYVNDTLVASKADYHESSTSFDSIVLTASDVKVTHDSSGACTPTIKLYFDKFKNNGYCPDDFYCVFVPTLPALDAPTLTATGYSGTYDGSSHAAKIKSNIAGTVVYYGTSSGATTYSVTCSSANTDYTMSSASRTNAGTSTYYYKDSSGRSTGSVSIAISKASGYINTPPTAKTLTYTGKAQSLVNAGSGASGTIYYNVDGGSWSTLVPSGTNAKTYSVGYYVAESTNYNATSAKYVSATIGKAAGQCTAPTATNPTYTGSSQNLITAGSSTTGTMYYNLDGGSWGTAIPKAAEAKAYTIGYYSKGDSNHEDTSAGYIVSTIGAYSVSVPTVTDTSKTYNGKSQSPSITYDSAGCTMSGTSAATNYGSYSIKFTLKNTTDYKWSDGTTAAKTYNWSIAKRSITITVTSITSTYDGNEHPCTAYSITSGSLASGQSIKSVKLTLSGTNLPKTVPNSPYTYTASDAVIVDSSTTVQSNYTTTYVSGTSTITKASGQCTAPTSISGLIWTGSSQTLINAGSSTTGTMYYKLNSGSFSTALPSAANSGNYTIYYYSLGDDNHESTSQSASITAKIDKAAGQLTAPEAIQNLKYNGQNQNIITEGSSSTGTVKYKLSGGTYSTTRPTGKNVGSYVVLCYSAGDSNHYDSGEVTITATISKADRNLICSPDEITVEFEGDPGSISVSYDDLDSSANLIAKSNDTNIVKVTLTNKQILVYGLSYGTTTISVSIAATTNYNSASASINATTGHVSGLIYEEYVDENNRLWYIHRSLTNE